MPEEVVSAKAENELPTISKDKPEIVQETTLQLEKSKKADEKSKNGGKSVASKNSRASQQKK